MFWIRVLAIAQMALLVRRNLEPGAFAQGAWAAARGKVRGKP